MSEIEQALHGMVGLVQLLSHNPDIPLPLREAIVCNHRYLEALRVIGEPIWPASAETLK